MALEVSTCAICGDAFAAPLDICYACATAADASTASAGAEHRGPAEGAAAHPVLLMRDFAALERLARLRLRPDDPIAAALLAKLDQSRILPPDVVAPDVATLGSRVVFSADGGPPEARVLVVPARHSPAGWTLPVTTPRGLALIGHRPGAIVVAARRKGATETLRLLAVAYQPNAAAVAAEAVRGETGLRPGGAGVAPPAGRCAPV